MIAGIGFVKHGNLSKSLIVLKVFWISTNAWDSSSMEWVMWWNIRFVSLLNVFKSSSVLQIMHWKGLNLTVLNFLNIFFLVSDRLQSLLFLFLTRVRLREMNRQYYSDFIDCVGLLLLYKSANSANLNQPRGICCHSNVNIWKFQVY